MSNAFSPVPATPGGHFRLQFYGAVLRLLAYIARLKALPAVQQRFPFLTGYTQEIQRYLPPGLPPRRSVVWWEQEMAAWQSGVQAYLPLNALENLSGVGCPGRAAFVLAGLVEEDSRFGTLLLHLQAPLPARRLTLETAGRILAMESGAGEELRGAGEEQPDGGGKAAPGSAGTGLGETGAWDLLRGLFAAGALEMTNPQAPRAEWALRVPTPLWDIARGAAAGEYALAAGEEIAAGFRFHPAEEFPPLEALILPEAFRQRLRQVPRLLEAGQARALVLRGGPGSIRLEVAGAVARALGRGLVEVPALPPASLPAGDVPSLPAGEHRELPVLPRSLGALCTLANALPAFTFDLAPGETASLPDLPGFPAAVVALLGAEGGLSGARAEGALTLALPFPGPDLRLQHWRAGLGQTQAAQLNGGLTSIVDRFILPGGYIRQAAAMAAGEAALRGRSTVFPEDVRAAARTLNRQALDNLAEWVEASGSWAQLVARDSTLGKLHELFQRCRYRERLLEALGPAFGSGANRGVRALFSGASGTGKTLAARILAAELGMDLYRVDLAAVINKYIGETEKNLHRVLSRAEELDVILLLDEGDSLLGSRTEVKTSNDRYANLETNYLLQRLENYQGILLVTTNDSGNIDQAFERRMDVVVPFTPPNAEERMGIWQLHLPQDHAVPEDALLSLAARCDLTGGQIRNAALLATLLAVGDAADNDFELPLQAYHLEAAVRAEYRKAGAVFPEMAMAVESAAGGDGAGPLGTFIDLLRGQR